jgi:non-ribosomal peptide synthase protein (TIGR01720 family)
MTAGADADSRIPLTPIQQWFFEQEFPELNHWNQALLLEVAQPLDRQLLDQAAAILVDRHTALKMRFHRDEGAWYAVQTTDLAESPVVWIDLAQSSASAVPLSATRVSNLVTNEAERLQTSLDVQKGPLFRIAYMHLGAGERHRLMIVAHHLVMDGISWRILLEDLQTIYTGLSQGMNSQQIIQSLPRKTASYAQWARRLANHAQSLSIAETGYWETFSRQVASRLSIGISLPTDFQLGPNDVASTDHVISTLGAAETEALLHQAPAAYRTDPQDILLTALTRAIGDWTGIPQLYLELEGHGREDIFENLDVSRTVGWFTTIYPVLLNLQGLAWPDKALLAVKEYLRRIPRRGFGFGLLRYLPQGERTGQVAAQIKRNISPPPISFNYLGQLDVGSHTRGIFKPAQDGRGADRGPGNPRGYLFEITAGVFEGSLQVHWSYSRNLHRRDTVETLACKTLTAAREIIQHCSSRQIAGYTSSDFELSGLDQSKLEKLLSRMGKPAPHASQEGE